MKAVYVLFLLAIGAPLLALIPTGDQDPETTDWDAAVEKAVRKHAGKAADDLPKSSADPYVPVLAAQ